MNHAAADVETNPGRDVTIEGDVTVSDVSIQDASGAVINPATEEKQDEIITLLEQIETNTGA
jgi:hypothetical protein